MVLSLFFASLISTAILTGLIWTIQLVHYPFFHLTERHSFEAHMTFHRTRISYIVVPVMLVELASSAALLFSGTQFQSEFIAAFILVLIIWSSTFFLQMPTHMAISGTYQPERVKKLITTNWIRTISWTLRLILLLFILSELSFSGLF